MDELRSTLDDALAGLQLPLSLVQLSRQPVTRNQYREHDGLLGAWLQQHGCQVVLVRPDHYVYGGAANLAQAQQLISQCLAELRD